MIRRPSGISAFEFAVLSGLRAAQLNRGCTPREMADAITFLLSSSASYVTGQALAVDGGLVMY